MDKDKEIIHSILDHEADDTEQKHLAELMEADPGLREDLTGLVNVVRLLEGSERLQPPTTFTAEVMRNLPRFSPSVWERFRNFFLVNRVLRWNMASALAVAVMAFVVLMVVVRSPQEPVLTRDTVPSAMVRLTFYSPEAQRVAVAGDFNKWKTDAHEMSKNGGIWSIDLKLKPGIYTYCFIVDGRSWVPDPGAEVYRDDGFGARNAVLRVSI